MANDTVGFEVDLAPQNKDFKSGNAPIIQTFSKRELINGRLPGEPNAEYIPIIGLDLEPIAVKLLDEFYYYDNSTESMQPPTATSGLDLPATSIVAKVNQFIKAEKNVYIKQMPFDYFKEDDQQDGSYQPIKGLVADSTYISIKTENFYGKEEIPRHGDLVSIKENYWFIETVNISVEYLPKEKKTLHISLKKVNK